MTNTPHNPDQLPEADEQTDAPIHTAVSNRPVVARAIVRTERKIPDYGTVNSWTLAGTVETVDDTVVSDRHVVGVAVCTPNYNVGDYHDAEEFAAVVGDMADDIAWLTPDGTLSSEIDPLGGDAPDDEADDANGDAGGSNGGAVQ